MTNENTTTLAGLIGKIEETNSRIHGILEEMTDKMEQLDRHIPDIEGLSYSGKTAQIKADIMDLSRIITEWVNDLRTLADTETDNAPVFLSPDVIV